MRKEELIADFFGGSFSDIVESDFISCSVSGKPFGDIGWDGNGSAAELGA